MTKKQKDYSKLKNQLQLQSMVIPGIIFLLIFAYIPMYGLVMAFKEYNVFTGLSDSPWIGFKFFIEFFKDPYFINVMRNTIFLNLAGLIIGFPAPIILAILICEIRSIRFKRVVQTVSYLPHFLSWVIFGGIALEMLSPNGILSYFMQMIGLSSKPVNFMSQADRFWIIYIVIIMIKNVGFSSILYIAAITGIDQQMFDAAEIDGASRFQKILRITVPSIMGTIVILLIFQISAILNTGIEQFLVLQNSLNLSWSETIDTYVYKVGLRQGRYSFAASVGFFKSVVSVILLVIANRVSRKVTGKGLF